MLKKAVFTEAYDEMVLVRDIDLFSMCEQKYHCPFCNSSEEREDPSNFPLSPPKIIMQESNKI